MKRKHTLSYKTMSIFLQTKNDKSLVSAEAVKRNDPRGRQISKSNSIR
jgi:hypothetical protein